MNLNDKQKEAVLENDRSLLIVAGAGTGKTRVITEKISYLMDKGVKSNSILALTFTNKAAEEMLERVKVLTKSNVLPFIGTFHSFCVFLLRKYGSSLGIDKNFSIVDRNDGRRIIKSILKKEGIDSVSPKAVQSIISKIKYKEIENDNSSLVKITNSILPDYEIELKTENALDFEDLLVNAVRLLKENKEVHKLVSETYKYILVDEFQDTDDIQNKLISLLKSRDTKIVAVGDLDQTIYSWRGANVSHMISFEKIHSPSKRIILDKNYRSTETIISAANSIISENKERFDKKLEAEKKGGCLISYFEGENEEEEVKLVCENISSLLDEGVSPSEIAVLYRANFQSRVLEEQLLIHKIPYNILGTRFFDRVEIKALLSYIQLSVGQMKKTAYSYAVKHPGRGIGDTSIEKLFNGEKDKISPRILKKIEEFDNIINEFSEKLDKSNLFDALFWLIQHIKYYEYIEDKLDNPDERKLEVGELLSLAKKYSAFSGEEGALKLLESASLGSDQDNLKGNMVSIMTVHASKGLEFKYIFIIGLEQGLFPYEFSEDVRDKEEERRLFYVALTRASDKVFCSLSKTRNIFGNTLVNTPSQFLIDIPKDLIENSSEDIKW